MIVSTVGHWITHCSIDDDCCVQYLHTGLVNPRCPRTHGPGGIHQSHLDVLCFKEFKLPELAVKPETPEEAKIGEFIAGNLVEDGATLQMGKKGFIKK